MYCTKLNCIDSMTYDLQSLSQICPVYVYEALNMANNQHLVLCMAIC